MGGQWNLLVIVCSVECNCPAARELVVGDLYPRETGHGDGRTMELAGDCVQC
jgi:hypothetical protein